MSNFTKKQWSPLWLILALAGAMAAYSFWLASNQTWSFNYSFPDTISGFGGNYYRNQALAILNGHLWLPPQYADWGECFYADGKCYGYFGILPSLVRLPLFALFGTTASNFTPLSIALASGLAMWAGLDLARRVLNNDSFTTAAIRQHTKLVLLAIFMILGPGSILSYLSQAKIFHEAILWMVSATVLCLNMSYRWLHGRSKIHLVLAVAAAIAATNSRPSAIPVTLVLGAYLLYRWNCGTTPKGLIARFVIPSTLVALPTATALGVIYLKLGMLTPSWEVYAGYLSSGFQQILSNNNGTTQGPRFFLTSLAQYLRPDSLSLASSYPWIHHAVPDPLGVLIIPPIVREGIYVENIASLTNTMPVPLLLTVTACASLLRNPRRLREPCREIAAAFLFATAAGFIAVLGMWGISTRYLGDFYPILLIGSLAGIILLAKTLEHRPKAFAGSLWTMVTLGLWSAFVFRQLLIPAQMYVG